MYGRAHWSPKNEGIIFLLSKEGLPSKESLIHRTPHWSSIQGGLMDLLLILPKEDFLSLAFKKTFLVVRPKKTFLVFHHWSLIREYPLGLLSKERLIAIWSK